MTAMYVGHDLWRIRLDEPPHRRQDNGMAAFSYAKRASFYKLMLACAHSGEGPETV